MAILIEAEVIIQAERGVFDLEAWLLSRPDEEFKLAAITVAELWHSAERASGPHWERRRLFLERLLAAFEVVPYTRKTGVDHARIWTDLEVSGQSIGAHELILAATAIQTGSTVATFNKRNYAGVKNLTVIEPK